MEPFLLSTGVVALGEIGGTTQLLALLLAARFKRPVPLLLGILAATFINHLFAGALGSWAVHMAGRDVMAGVIGICFITLAVWTLIPRPVEREAKETKERFGVFGTTLLAFLLAESGDKSQIAAIAMAAQYDELLLVVCGTTLGMTLAILPVVLVGDRWAPRIPLQMVHGMAALMFAALGITTLLGA